MDQLQKLVKKELFSSDNTKLLSDRAQTLLIFERTFLDKSQKYLFDSGLIRHLLQLGTAFRRGDDELAKTVLAIFGSLRKIITKDGEISDFRYVVFHGMALANSFHKFAEMGNSLVWSDERHKIERYLAEGKPTDLNKIKKFKKIFRKRFELLRRGGQITTDFWEKTEYLLTIAESNDSGEARLAARALSYLVVANDYVPDKLGIFGLVDDIEAIEIVYQRFKEDMQGEILLQEFLSVDNAMQSLLLEREAKEKPLHKPLVPLGKPIMISILSSNFLLQSGKKRVLQLVPDRGITILSQLLSLTIMSKRKTEKQRVLPEKGAKIYFNRPNSSLEVIFDGRSKMVPGKVTVYNEANLDNPISSSVMIPEVALDFCTLQPKRKRIEQNAGKLMDWLVQDQSFVPPHISFEGKRFAKIFLLTNLNRFRKMLIGFKPFGLNLGNFLDFKYEATTGSKESLLLQPATSNNRVIDVFSSAELVYEKLEDLGSELENTLLLCDDEVLAENFLGIMSDSWGFENLSILIIAELHNRKIQTISGNRNFVSLSMQPHFQELANQDLISQSGVRVLEFVDPITNFENKIVRASKIPDYEFRIPENNIINSFLQIERAIWKENSAGAKINDQLLFKLQKLSTLIIKSWLPPSSEEIGIIMTLISELIKLAEYESTQSPQVSGLLSLLRDNDEKLLKIPESRGVLKHLIENPEKKLNVFTEYETNIPKITFILSQKNIKNAHVYSPSTLAGNFLNGSLIVPYLPSIRFTQLLTSSSVSENLLLFFSEFEKKSFDGRSARAKNQNRHLAFANADSFSGTSLEKKMKTITRKFQERPIKVEKETDNYISDKIKSYSNKYIYEGKDSSETIPFYFNENTKFLFIPPRASIFCIDDEKKFYRIDAKDISEGNRFCLLTGAKSDLLDYVTSSTNPEYDKYKSKGSIWREELQELMRKRWVNDFSSFQLYLEQNGIKRTEITIRNWLKDTTIIAPQKYKDTISKMTNLDGISEKFKDKVNTVIESIEKSYEARRNAESSFLISLNQSSSFTSNEEEVITRMGSKSFRFDVITITAVGRQISVPNEDLWKIQEVT